MSGVDLKISGRDEFLKLAIESAKLDEAIRKDIRDLAALYRQRLVSELRAVKSGRQYGPAVRTAYRRTRRTVTLFGGMTARVPSITRTPKATKTYRASAPGEAPAMLTGTLVRSIRTKYPRAEKGYGVKIFAHRGTAFYRHFLEFGAGPARKGRRIGAGGIRAPRPLFSPMQEKLEADLEAKIQAAVAQFAERDA